MERPTGKALVGPGGMKCSCCTKGPRGYHKRLSIRELRRKAKKEARQALKIEPE